jgi:5-methylcytosine-specific restriction endonuclease McrA
MSGTLNNGIKVIYSVTCGPKKRKWILEKQNFKCERCGDKAVQVHHLTYERVGYELPGDLMAVCLSCHGKEHSENPDLRILSQFKLNNL